MGVNEMKKDWTLSEDRHQLVEKSLPLVRWTISRFISCGSYADGLGFDDLYQEGCLALCRAAAAYRDDKGEFSTLAVTAIRNHLLEYCARIVTQARNLPTLSLEAMNEDGREIEADSAKAQTPEDDTLSRLCIGQFLGSRKQRYTGSARLGVEALELKVLVGCGVTEIARLYDSKPNEVGAWISKAAKRMRQDATESELHAFGLQDIA